MAYSYPRQGTLRTHSRHRYVRPGLVFQTPPCVPRHVCPQTPHLPVTCLSLPRPVSPVCGAVPSFAKICGEWELQRQLGLSWKGGEHLYSCSSVSIDCIYFVSLHLLITCCDQALDEALCTQCHSCNLQQLTTF